MNHSLFRSESKPALAAIARHAVRLAVLPLLTLLYACGGNDVAGIDQSGEPVAVAQNFEGVIDGFGSVIVNGVRFSTEDARIQRQEGSSFQTINESDLRIGQYVQVQGVIDPLNPERGEAKVINYSPLLLLPGAEALAFQDLQIMGSNFDVEVDELTVADFDFSIFNEPAATTQFVFEVSGFVDSEGRYRATRIDRIASTQNSVERTFQAGVITVLPDSQELVLQNGIRVDAGSATINLVKLVEPQAQPVNFLDIEAGQTLLITGTFTATPDQQSGEATFIASEITILADRVGPLTGVFSGSTPTVIFGEPEANLELSATGALGELLFAEQKIRVLVNDQTQVDPALLSASAGFERAIRVAALIINGGEVDANGFRTAEALSITSRVAPGLLSATGTITNVDISTQFPSGLGLTGSFTLVSDSADDDAGNPLRFEAGLGTQYVGFEVDASKEANLSGLQIGDEVKVLFGPSFGVSPGDDPSGMNTEFAGRALRVQLLP